MDESGFVKKDLHDNVKETEPKPNHVDMLSSSIETKFKETKIVDIVIPEKRDQKAVVDTLLFTLTPHRVIVYDPDQFSKEMSDKSCGGGEENDNDVPIETTCKKHCDIVFVLDTDLFETCVFCRIVEHFDEPETKILFVSKTSIGMKRCINARVSTSIENDEGDKDKEDECDEKDEKDEKDECDEKDEKDECDNHLCR